MVKVNDSNRRAFLKKTGLAAAAVVIAGNKTFPSSPSIASQNKLPKWKGFNLLDFFSPDRRRPRPSTEEQQLKWMSDWGFDFVRIPMAYPSYVKFDRETDITTKRIRKFDRKATDRVEHLAYLAHKYGLHVSLNLHRAPGFCVNAGFAEPYNLWKDPEAMDDFCHHWKFWAKRFKNISPDKISFDLLNEPCLRENMNDQHSK